MSTFAIDRTTSYLAAGTQIGEIDLWDVGRERLLGSIPATSRQMLISALEFSGERLIATHYGSHIQVFDMRQQSWTALACRLTAGPRDSGEATGLIGEPDGICSQ